VNTGGRQGFLLLICRCYVHRLWLRFGRQDLVGVYSDGIDLAQAPDDLFHDRDSQYSSRDVFYHTPFCSQVSRLPTNHNSHFFLFQLLSQGNEHLLPSNRTNSNLILPFSFSVHPSQDRFWGNTGGSQGFSSLIRWGYVDRLLIQGHVPGWIRFVRQDLVCVHSNDVDSSFLIWVCFYTFVVLTLYIPSCVDHLSKRHMM
jgi:hypothetical protein